MKRVLSLTALLVILLTAGIVLAQNSPDDNEEERIVAFEIESEIGRALPRSIVYDTEFEQYAVVDAYGRLMLIDALTFETKHILYERGNYNDIAFSHDGRWLALAIASRIELWDTQTGQLRADLVDLGQAIRIVGPLAFSRGDNLLQFEGIYPAPRSIRLNENDTIRVPWLWNLTAARDEGLSTFPRQVEAWQFFDYRNGFVIGPDDRIVAALPGRLQVLDAYSLDLLFEIPTDRYERDPLNVWFSARDNQIYVRPVNTNSLIQVDTQRGALVELPLGEWLTLTDLEQIGGIELSEQAQVIGEANSRLTFDLLEAFLGQNYTRDVGSIYRFRSLTVTLIDLIVPPANTGDNITALLFVFDEQRDEGRFVISRAAEQMVLSPDESTILLRRTIDGDERVFTYDLASGEELRNFIPALRAIGGYNRSRKNRVLAYTENSNVIVSDFQRYNSDTNAVLAEDLRYSRRFDRFFFSGDSENVITLSGTEWRVWSVATGEVLRREVLNLRGSIMATSTDGFRFLTRYTDLRGNGVEVVDLQDNTRQNINFDTLPARDIVQVIPDAGWENLFVIYGDNPWGQYSPGNEIAMYNLDRGRLWFIAGDDLPPAFERQYGWVSDDTVYVIGNGVPSDQPARVYGLQYDPSSLPLCVVDTFPDEIDQWSDRWEWLVVNLRTDALANLTSLICDDLPQTSAALNALLAPTATPPFMTPTPIVIGDTPTCLTAKYPERAEEYATLWEQMTVGLSQEQIDKTEELLCEGIGEIRYSQQGEQAITETMLIDARTGERATGAFTPQERITRPIYPIQELFEKTEEHPLGTAILAPNEEIIAVSSLPGELVVYRMIITYQSLLDNITATASANLAQRNLIAELASPTPTFNVVGTPRPTLTPTMTLTPIPPPQERVDQPQAGEVADMCPLEQLLTMDNLPEGYSPIGRIIAPIQGDVLWVIEPENGRRYPDEDVPLCGFGIDCNFSPDRQWILGQDLDEIFVVRPDGTDQRVLFGEDDVWPRSEIRWAGSDTLEYEVTVERERNGRREFVTGIQQDILGIFPDPEPWVPEVVINNLPATIVSRQQGGTHVIVYTVFSTGFGPGYKYYVYDFATGTSEYFARLADYPPEQLSVSWHPSGDRLFYYYPPPPNRAPIWYQFKFGDGTQDHRLLGNLPGGTWSNEGRYRAFATNRRTQPIAVWDSETGLTRTYCIPETGARFYDGSFVWSPDSRYIALRAPLPKDETVEGIGQHVMILNIETGEIVDLTTGAGSLVTWAIEPGGYGGNR